MYTSAFFSNLQLILSLLCATKVAYIYAILSDIYTLQSTGYTEIDNVVFVSPDSTKHTHRTAKMVSITLPPPPRDLG